MYVEIKCILTFNNEYHTTTLLFYTLSLSYQLALNYWISRFLNFPAWYVLRGDIICNIIVTLSKHYGMLFILLHRFLKCAWGGSLQNSRCLSEVEDVKTNNSVNTGRKITFFFHS